MGSLKSIFVGACVLAVALAANAQTYPAKPIRFILPVGAGASSDVLGRLFAEKLGERLGQQILTDNKPGAGGNIALPIAASAPPDGYTMVLLSSSQTISPSLYRKMSYDLLRDFAPVTQFAAGFYMLAVHPSVPARSVKELVALAKARPGQLNFGSPGIGTGVHLTGALFKSAAGIDMVHVSYRGMGAAITALLGGEVSVLFMGIPSGREHAKAGKLRPLAVTSATRMRAVPELPTMIEAGFKGFEVSTWQGIAVPAATPRGIITLLHAESMKALQSTELRQRFDALEVEPVGSTPEQFANAIKLELARWAKVVREAKISVE